MDKSKPTLAIYGIQDRFNYPYPFYVHDHNLALSENGRILNYLQLERETRIKRDNTLFRHLYRLLKEKKLLAADCDLVFVDNVVGRAFISAEGDARFEAAPAKTLACGAEEGRCWWYGQEKKAWVLNHELAHIFSCLPFCGNFRENSLLIHFDGGASLSNFSAWTYRNGQISLLEFHWDLKQLTSVYNANALVFAILGEKMANQNAVPGKLMGYAGWGSYNPDIEKWLSENGYFENIWAKKSVFFEKTRTAFGIRIKSFDTQNPFLQDIAATFQTIFRRETLKKLEQLAEQSGCRHLYYAGGCALNIFTNTAIVESGIFDSVFIPPCADDSGLALGAAAYMEWKKHGEAALHQPYLNNWGIEKVQVKPDQENIKKTAEMLLQNQVVGVCNGYGETGPRALGNRSLLALAHSKPLARKLSTEMKGREWYRPLAPVALEKNVAYFTGKIPHGPLPKYMLADFGILPERQDEISGAVHSNGSARFQSVGSREENPFLYSLLDYLDKNHNVKALINTSFNLRGEPIVHTGEDALSAAKKMHIGGIVLNGESRPL